MESEPDAGGEPVPVLAVFLTNRECPWRCVFCDLWRHTLERQVAPGDIPAQVDLALAAVRGEVPRPRWLKWYNAGSFFDPGAIPVVDHPDLARRAAGFERVIVECHPALVGDRVWRFRDLLEEAARGAGYARAPVLEVAMGLETVNPAVLPRLNKQVTLEGFRRASQALGSHGVAMRAFVLVQPPFEAPGEAVTWAARSTAFALDCGGEGVTLIPVRGGNGALEALQREGLFAPAALGILEAAFEASLAVSASAGRGRVLADLWDLERLATCATCAAARLDRLRRMNAGQSLLPSVACTACRP